MTALLAQFAANLYGRRPLLLCVGLLLLTAGSSAYASLDIFRVNPGDLSIATLKQIIGDWTSEAAHMQSIFSSAIRTFNIAVLAFGAAVFGYTALVGTLQTAHDGQLLGKQWSTVWVPIRFTAGVTLLVPTTTGLCLAQLGMLWLLGQGVGLASTVWSHAVHAHTDEASVYVASRSVSHPEVREVISRALANEMCVIAMNRTQGNGQAFGMNTVQSRASAQDIQRAEYEALGEAWMLPDAAEQVSHVSGATGGEILWGGRPGSGYAPDTCGRVKVPNTRDNPEHQVRNVMGNAQMDALIASIIYLRHVAQAAMKVAPGEPGMSAAEISGHIDGAVNTYRAHMGSTLQDVVNAQNKQLTVEMRRTADEDGWFTAGTWFFQIARINKELNDMATSLPTVEMPGIVSRLWSWIRYEDAGAPAEMNRESVMKLDGLSEEDAQRIVLILESANKRFDDLQRSMRRTQDLEISQDVGSTQHNRFFRGMDKISHVITEGAEGLVGPNDFAYDRESSVPAIIQMKAVGDWMIGATWAVFLVDQVASKFKVFDGIKSAIKLGTGGSGSIIMTLLTFLVIALFAFGVILAFWLPMLPFVNWVGGLLGWVIASIEMLIATPVWLAAHLHPDGDGMASRQAASGYMIILELLLRPVLMVFGLIAAIIIVDPMLNIIASMFYPAFATVTADAMTGPITWVMKIIMFAVLCWIAINFTFKAINSVPAGVMKWIGGMQGSNAEMGESLGETSRTIVVAGAHKMAGSIEMMKHRNAMQKDLSRGK